MRLSTIFALGILATAGVTPSAALAGACPTCTTDNDCITPQNPNARCVTWASDFGCGAQRVACCPGQACVILGDGTPSCALTPPPNNCTYSGSPGADAGLIDSGSPAADAGAGVDTGTGPAGDGGVVPAGDGGVVPPRDASVRDVGTSTSGNRTGGRASRDSGCSCSSSNSGFAEGLSALSMAALVLLRRRRR